MSFLEKTYSIRIIQTNVLCLLGLLYLYFGLEALHTRILVWSDGYALGDWLITYEDGGFKRRGLSGCILIFFARITGIYVGTLLFYLLTGVYVLFISLIVIWLRKKRFDFYLLLFFLLPTTFFFSINDFYVFGRKEILLFLLMLLFVMSYKRNINIHSWKYIISFSSLLFILTLFHELVVFFVSYILTIYAYDFFCQKKGSLFKIIVLGLSTFIPALSVFIFGADINEGNSWQIFKSLGVGPNVMNGIFSWPKEGFGSGKVNALDFAKEHHYEYYILSYLITLFSILLLLFKNKFSIKKIALILSFLFLIQIISAPIFFLTIDWGRWLNIHFMMILFIFSLFYETNEGLGFKIKECIEKMKKPKIYFKLLILFLLTFSFSMYHVEKGFVFGQNQFLLNIRDLIWQIRHINF